MVGVADALMLRPAADQDWLKIGRGGPGGRNWEAHRAICCEFSESLPPKFKAQRNYGAWLVAGGSR